MSGFSTSLANAIINNTLRGQAMPTWRTLYFALFTADPTDAFTAGQEVSASWYTRVAAGAFASPAAGVSYNTTTVSFPAVTGASVTVTHIAVIEGSSASDVTSTMLYSFPLSAPQTLAIGGVYVVQSTGSAGDWTLSLL